MASLLDLKPRKASFRVRINGRRKKLTLRPFSLRDQAWIQENYPGTDLYEKLTGNDVVAMARVIWHQLDPKSKRAIMRLKATYTDIDEVTGKKIKVNPEGHRRLIAMLDMDSLLAGMEAFAACQGLNAAVIDEILNGVVKKKPTMRKRTGAKSLISSPPSTAIQ